MRGKCEDNDETEDKRKKRTKWHVCGERRSVIDARGRDRYLASSCIQRPRLTIGGGGWAAVSAWNGVREASFVSAKLKTGPEFTQGIGGFGTPSINNKVSKESTRLEARGW